MNNRHIWKEFSKYYLNVQLPLFFNQLFIDVFFDNPHITCFFEI